MQQHSGGCERVDGTTPEPDYVGYSSLDAYCAEIRVDGTECDVSVNERRNPSQLLYHVGVCAGRSASSDIRYKKWGGRKSAERVFRQTNDTRARAFVSSLAAAASLRALASARGLPLLHFFFFRQRQPAIPAAAPPPRSCILRPCSARLHPHLEKRRAARKATDRQPRFHERCRCESGVLKQRDTAAAAAECVAEAPTTRVARV